MKTSSFLVITGGIVIILASSYFLIAQNSIPFDKSNSKLTRFNDIPEINESNSIPTNDLNKSEASTQSKGNENVVKYPDRIEVEELCKLPLDSIFTYIDSQPDGLYKSKLSDGIVNKYLSGETQFHFPDLLKILSKRRYASSASLLLISKSFKTDSFDLILNLDNLIEHGNYSDPSLPLSCYFGQMQLLDRQSFCKHFSKLQDIPLSDITFRYLNGAGAQFVLKNEEFDVALKWIINLPKNEASSADSVLMNYIIEKSVNFSEAASKFNDYEKYISDMKQHDRLPEMSSMFVFQFSRKNPEELISFINSKNWNDTLKISYLSSIIKSNSVLDPQRAKTLLSRIDNPVLQRKILEKTKL